MNVYLFALMVLGFAVWRDQWETFYLVANVTISWAVGRVIGWWIAGRLWHQRSTYAPRHGRGRR